MIQVGTTVRQATYPEGHPFGPVRTVTAMRDTTGPCCEPAFWCGDLGLTTLCAIEIKGETDEDDNRH